MMRAGLVLAAAALLAAAAARADENQDLSLIPEAAQQPASPPPPSTGDARQRIYLEDAVTAVTRRSDLAVPFPPPAPYDWQERLFLDLRTEWQPAERVTLAYSGRINVRAQDNLPIPNHEDFINDFREGVLSWEPADRTYLEVGRINLKSGVAAGFNPTDFFRTRAVVEPISSDPAVLREDRLGAFMVQAQHIGEGATLTAAFAPAIAAPSPVYRDTDLAGLRPGFDRTNAHDRVLLKASADIVPEVSSELLLYREGNATQFGANLTHGIGQSVVAYAEWSGGRRPSLIDAALQYGQATGTIPPAAPSALPDDARRHFQNDLSVGASYTTEAKITFNLEYHFHQAGFSRQDWDNWFRIGRVGAGSPVANELWYIRAYASEQQEPVSEHALFLRADWVDAFIPKLELTAFVNIDLFDGSSFAQLESDYYLSNAWTVGALMAANPGTRRSEYGSLPAAASVLVKLARYF